MKRLFLALLYCLVATAAAFAQATGNGGAARLRGYTTVLPATRMASPDSLAARLANVIGVAPLMPNKSFNYAITASGALGGGTYTGTILGRNPTANGKTTTAIPTQIIPLVITINDGSTTVTYDPTVADACVPGTPTDVGVITASPVFTNNTWTMNGVNVGTTQYIDAFQRAQFWSKVQGTAYHVILNDTTLGPRVLSFTGSANGSNFSTGLCGGFLGIVNLNAMDSILQGLITGPLASMVNTGTLPIFLTKEVVESEIGVSLNGCCVLGYHSALFVGRNTQVYSLFSVDGSGVFGPGYTDTISHELAEAVNDPTTNNATPSWGNIGQVQSACQNNLEVGDPLSSGNPPNDPTSPFSVAGGNGLTYSVQELTYYSWFFGSTALGVGTGGKYSDNGTFSLPAYICPPGTPSGGPY